MIFWYMKKMITKYNKKKQPGFWRKIWLRWPKLKLMEFFIWTIIMLIVLLLFSFTFMQK